MGFENRGKVRGLVGTKMTTNVLGMAGVFQIFKIPFFSRYYLSNKKN